VYIRYLYAIVAYGDRYQCSRHYGRIGGVKLDETCAVTRNKCISKKGKDKGCLEHVSEDDNNDIFLINFWLYMVEVEKIGALN
jgi:hypothetical protein